MNRKLVEHFKSNMSQKLLEYTEQEWEENVYVDGEGNRIGSSSFGFIPPVRTDRIRTGARRGWDFLRRNIKRIPRIGRYIP